MPSNRRSGPLGIEIGPALVAGLVAGGGMGLLLHYQLFVLPLFGFFYGYPTVLGGAVVHAIASLVFALLFAAVVSHTSVTDRVQTVLELVGAGLVYGIGLWVVAFGIGLPVLTRITAARGLPFPYLPLDGLVAHLVFGFLLGLTFALVR